MKPGKMNNKKETKFYYVKESLLQSVLADIVSFGGFFVLLTINYKFWEGEQIVTIFLLVLWVSFTMSKIGVFGKKEVFRSDTELIKYLSDNQNEQTKA